MRNVFKYGDGVRPLGGTNTNERRARIRFRPFVVIDITIIIYTIRRVTRRRLLILVRVSDTGDRVEQRENTRTASRFPTPGRRFTLNYAAERASFRQMAAARYRRTEEFRHFRPRVSSPPIRHYRIMFRTCFEYGN